MPFRLLLDDRVIFIFILLMWYIKLNEFLFVDLSLHPQG